MGMATGNAGEGDDGNGVSEGKVYVEGEDNGDGDNDGDCDGDSDGKGKVDGKGDGDDGGGDGDGDGGRNVCGRRVRLRVISRLRQGEDNGR